MLNNTCQRNINDILTVLYHDRHSAKPTTDNKNY